MSRHFLRHVVLLAAGVLLAHGQADNPRVELMNLRQEMAELRQRVGELTLAVEQLNKSVSDTNRVMQAALSDQKRDVLAQVAAQLERLGKQTNAALDSLAKSQATRPVVQTAFTDDFPKEGVNYTVQSGDSLAIIAKKNNAKMKDIINANKLSDPSRITVGQTLFIPQGK